MYNESLMARSMHPDAQEAANHIMKTNCVPAIDARGKTPLEIRDRVRRLRDVYGESAIKVIEIFNRDQSRSALDAMPLLYDDGLLPVIGSAVLEEHVYEANRRKGVGYVSFGGTEEALIFAAIRAPGGARLAIPCVTTPAELCSVNRAKIKAWAEGERVRAHEDAEYISQLPEALHRIKLFPMVSGHPAFPDVDADLEAKWSEYLDLMLNTQAEEQLNCSVLVTGLRRPEQALKPLQRQSIAGRPAHVAIGPALATAEEAYPWFEAIAIAKPDSPWEDILAQARRKMGKVVHLNRIMAGLPSTTCRGRTQLRPQRGVQRKTSKVG